MPTRHSARALVLDPEDRLLLLRCDVPGKGIFWVAPGGGIERGETPREALRREVYEETGYVLAEEDPPHVWCQRVLGTQYVPGYDGVHNDYFLLRTAAFEPRSDLWAAELIDGWRWWPLPEIVAYRGTGLFSPRDLATPLTALIRTGPPAGPVPLAL